MMTADVANQIAYTANEPERIERDKQADSDIEDILDRIKFAAENGEYSLLIDLKTQPLKSDVFNIELRLESLGFECVHTVIAPRGRAVVDDLLIKWWSR